NDGTDDSNTVTVTLTVNSVNDVPSFTKGADENINEDAGAQTVNGWATSISAGPADESGQSVNFLVSNNNNSLFSAQPSIDSSGTLTYTPTANANGTATVTVRIHDDGGTSNSGVDTSASQTFTITVNAVNDAPVSTGESYGTNEDTALVVNAGSGVLTNDTDVDADTLTAVKVTDPSHGTLTLNANGSFTYTPD